MDTDTPFDLSCHSRLNIAQASSQLYAALFENTIYLVIVTSVNLYFQYNCNLVIFGPDRSILIWARLVFLFYKLVASELDMGVSKSYQKI